MCKEVKFLRDENDLIISVDEIIADATKRLEKIDTTTNSSSDDESLVLEKDELPRYLAEIERWLDNTTSDMAIDIVKRFYKKLKHC